jgi:hypothetical protein
MKKLLGIIILSLFCCTISYAQIIKLTKCYVNSMDDRKNPSSNWNYNNKTWNENSFYSFMKQYGLTISSIIVNTETSNLSLIDGTEEDLNKINYKITDYYDGIILFEEDIFPTDPTSPVESYSQTKITLNIKTGKMKMYHKNTLRIFSNANDPPREKLVSDYTYRMICKVGSNNKGGLSNKGNSTLRSILKMLK